MKITIHPWKIFPLASIFWKRSATKPCLYLKFLYHKIIGVMKLKKRWKYQVVILIIGWLAMDEFAFKKKIFHDRYKESQIYKIMILGHFIKWNKQVDTRTQNLSHSNRDKLGSNLSVTGILKNSLEMSLPSNLNPFRASLIPHSRQKVACSYATLG